MITVSELNEKIKAILEATFMHIVVEGEVGSVTYHSSGHVYFSLKDEKSTIKCVMWRSNVKRLKFKIEQGEHIVVDASVGVYSPRGEYQLIAVKVEPFGKGALALAYEQLKAKLEKKGYFNKEHKRALPKFPKRVAIVTALNGAALQDMLKVASKRWPLVEIVVVDVLVQGESAKSEVAKAIDYANTLDCDIIVVSRGGGSQEDLWAFNEEIVADAIYNATTPTVSAIGHEVDFLISDFVADLRAPTPSAAIEMILPDCNEYLMLLDEQNSKIDRNIELKLKGFSQELNGQKEQLALLSPIDRLKLITKEFANLEYSLNSAIEYKLKLFSSDIEPLFSKLDNTMDLELNIKSNKLQLMQEQLKGALKQREIKKGFVEVTQAGKRVDICNIKNQNEFTLVSNSCKLDVKAQGEPTPL
jgi:exodeoxyribonuclease VII large subunit